MSWSGKGDALEMIRAVWVWSESAGTNLSKRETGGQGRGDRLPAACARSEDLNSAALQRDNGLPGSLAREGSSQSAKSWKV